MDLSRFVVPSLLFALAACGNPPEQSTSEQVLAQAEESAPVTPLSLHGKLTVDGVKLVDECGRPTQLRGVSHFWHTWEGKEH